MVKIKILAVAFLLILVGIVLNGSHQISVSASDAENEIANYKTWARITKEPITVQFDISSSGGG